MWDILEGSYNSFERPLDIALENRLEGGFLIFSQAGKQVLKGGPLRGGEFAAANIFESLLAKNFPQARKAFVRIRDLKFIDLCELTD